MTQVAARPVEARTDPVRRRWEPVRASTVQLLPPFALVVVLLGLAARHGLRGVDAVAALLVVVGLHTVPGAVVWRAVRTWRGTLLEDVVAGTAVGGAAAVIAQAVAGSTGIALAAWSPLLLVLLLLDRDVRERVLTAPTAQPPWWFATAVSFATLPVLPVLESFQRGTPVAWSSGFREIYVDVHFHLSLVGQLQHRGPTSIPYVEGEALRYHWFSHAWVAQITETSGVEAESVLLRVGPQLLAVLVALAVAVTAARLSSRWWAGPVAAVVALGTGDVNLFRPLTAFGGGKFMTPGALSLGFSGLVLVVLLLLVAMRWRTRSTRWGSLLVLVLAVVAAGSKGSSLPLLVAGAMLATAVALWRRSSWRPLAVDLGLLTGALVLVAVVVLGGGAGRGALDPLTALREAGASLWLLRPVIERSPWLVLLAVGVLALSTLARAAPLLLASVVDGQPRDPVLVLVLGAVLAGVGVTFLLTVPGTSQAYFLRNAVPLVGIGTALGLVRLLTAPDVRPTTTVGAGIVGGLVSVLVLARGFGTLPRFEPGLGPSALARGAAVLAVLALVGVLVARSPARPRQVLVAVSVGLLVLSLVPSLQGRGGLRAVGGQERDPTERFGVSADQIEASRWLRDHSGPDAIVATNRHCASPVWVECDSRRFAVAAYTERQVLVEGWAYTRSWTLSPPRVDEPDVYRFFTDPELLATNDAFFTDPGPETAAALVELGVDWLYVDRTEDFDPSILEHATLRYETPWALVLEGPTVAAVSR